MTTTIRRAPAPAHHVISPDPEPLGQKLLELAAARDLLGLLVRRELQVRYKQTALGIVWIVLQPLVPAILLALVLGAFARLPSDGVPYLSFALVGFVLYQFFASALSRVGASLIRDAGLITKIYFPRAVLPIAASTATVVDFAIGLCLALIVIVATGGTLTLNLLLVPLVALLTLTLATCAGMGVAALNAHYRDFGHLIPFALQVVLYGSPVMYSIGLLPSGVRDLAAVNPLVALLEAFRWALLGTAPPTTTQLLLGAASWLVVSVAGVWLFDRASRDMTDVI